MVSEGPTLRARGGMASRPRRSARVAAALAAAPLLAGALLCGFRVQGPPSPLAAAETLVFVPLPTGELGLLHRGQLYATSRVARAAGYEGKPGARPQLDDEPAPDTDKPKRMKVNEETVEMQFDRVQRTNKWLKTLRGKFVPYGPKPWDKHRFLKVCIQTRLRSKQASNTKILNQVTEEIRRISGSHPKIVKAKTNVAAFGWRVGYPCGVAVNIYGNLMMDFLNRLNMIILPRVRDFEGLHPSSIDARGNLWLGFENQEPFKELDELIDTREIVHGFDVGLINNCLTQPDGLALMKDFGFPFGESRPKKIKVFSSYIKVGS